MLTKIQQPEGEEPVADDETPLFPFKLEFTKKRLCTNSNKRDFVTQQIELDGDRLVATRFVSPSASPQPRGDLSKVKAAAMRAYDRLADSAPVTAGHDGKGVRKVSVDDLRSALRDGGFLAVDDSNHLTQAARKLFQRAKIDMLSAGFQEAGSKIWRA